MIEDETPIRVNNKLIEIVKSYIYRRKHYSPKVKSQYMYIQRQNFPNNLAINIDYLRGSYI